MDRRSYEHRETLQRCAGWFACAPFEIGTTTGSVDDPIRYKRLMKLLGSIPSTMLVAGDEKTTDSPEAEKSQRPSEIVNTRSTGSPLKLRTSGSGSPTPDHQ